MVVSIKRKPIKSVLWALNISRSEERSLLEPLASFLRVLEEVLVSLGMVE